MIGFAARIAVDVAVSLLAAAVCTICHLDAFDDEATDGQSDGLGCEVQGVAVHTKGDTHAVQ